MAGKHAAELGNGFSAAVEVEEKVWSVIGPDRAPHSINCQFVQHLGGACCSCDYRRREYTWWWKCWVMWWKAINPPPWGEVPPWPTMYQGKPTLGEWRPKP